MVTGYDNMQKLLIPSLMVGFSHFEQTDNPTGPPRLTSTGDGICLFGIYYRDLLLSIYEPRPLRRFRVWEHAEKVTNLGLPRSKQI